MNDPLIRIGSPFSYARFRDAQYICVACQDFGGREYGAMFTVIDQFPQRLVDGWVPPCDICEKQLRYVESVTVALPPFIGTPVEIARLAALKTVDIHGGKLT